MKFFEHEGNLLRHSDCAIVRPRFSYHDKEPDTSLKLRATLRAGPYAWPGGYELCFVMKDGGAMHFTCVKREFKRIAKELRNPGDPAWLPACLDTNWEENDLYCEHCNEKIAPAYGDDDA
jgi:ribosomal protein L24E